MVNTLQIDIELMKSIAERRLRSEFKALVLMQLSKPCEKPDK